MGKSPPPYANTWNVSVFASVRDDARRLPAPVRSSARESRRRSPGRARRGRGGARRAADPVDAPAAGAGDRELQHVGARRRRARVGVQTSSPSPAGSGAAEALGDASSQASSGSACDACRSGRRRATRRAGALSRKRTCAASRKPSPFGLTVVSRRPSPRNGVEPFVTCRPRSLGAAARGLPPAGDGDREERAR